MIHGSIAAGTSQYGMQTFDQHLFLMYSRGTITYDDAMRYASNKDEIKLKVQGVSTTSDMARDEMMHAAMGRPGASPEIMRFSS